MEHNKSVDDTQFAVSQLHLLSRTNGNSKWEKIITGIGRCDSHIEFIY